MKLKKERKKKEKKKKESKTNKHLFFATCTFKVHIIFCKTRGFTHTIFKHCILPHACATYIGYLITMNAQEI